jgi:hypothetical protein
MTTDYIKLRAALVRERWQEAYGALAPCRGKDDAEWKRAAEEIEACKAEALAALTAAWQATKVRRAA